MATAHATLKPHARPQLTAFLQEVTPTEAARSLRQDQFPRQRPLRPYHVQYLKGLMDAGHFREGSEIHYAQIGNGKAKFLINGQHTLSAIRQRQDSTWLTVMTYRGLPDMAAMDALYATFDRNLPRQLVDVYKASAGIAALQLTSKALNALSAACLLLAQGFAMPIRDTASDTRTRQLQRDAQLRGPLIEAWHDEMELLLALLHRHKRQRPLFMRGSVLAVALVTLRHQTEQAQQFWGSVAADSGLLAGTPAHTLLAYLRTLKGQRISPWTIARYVARAWNAAFAHSRLATLHAQDPHKPIAIAGTPHDGKTVRGYLTLAGKVERQPVALEDTP